VKAVWVDESALYLANHVDEQMISATCIASTTNFVIHSNHRDEIVEGNISTEVRVNVSEVFGYEIITFAPKYYPIYPRQLPNYWIAVIGDRTLMNPGGSVVSVDIYRKSNKFEAKIVLFGALEKCTFALSSLAKDLEIVQCNLFDNKGYKISSLVDIVVNESKVNSSFSICDISFLWDNCVGVSKVTTIILYIDFFI
jgi:hypothetical protein